MSLDYLRVFNLVQPRAKEELKLQIIRGFPHSENEPDTGDLTDPAVVAALIIALPLRAEADRYTALQDIRLDDQGNLVINAESLAKLQPDPETPTIENPTLTILNSTFRALQLTTLDSINQASFEKGLVWRAIIETIKELFVELTNEWAPLFPGGTGYTEITGELLGGLNNGSNKDFTTANDFVPGSAKVYKRGQRQLVGASFDYIEVAPNIIRFNTAPKPGAKLLADYIKQSIIG